MGAFVDAMSKMRAQDREARKDACDRLMERHGITRKDIDEGRWEFRHTGPFGKTAIRLYKLVETVEITVESLVRVSVSESEEK